MGFVARKNGSDNGVVNVQYNRVLGAMYELNSASKEVMGSITDEEKRIGFRSSSANALIAKLEGKAVASSAIEGNLIYVGVSSAEDSKGISREYLKVGIRDGEEKVTYFLSVPLRDEIGLEFVHRLAGAQFGEPTKIVAYGKEEKGNDGKIYSGHQTGLRQNGETVPAVFVMTADERKAIREKMKAEGDDNESIRKELLKQEYLKTKPQVEAILARYAEYQAEKKSVAEHAEHAGAGAAADGEDPILPEAKKSAGATQSGGAPDFSDEF